MTRQTNPVAIASLVLGLLWFMWIGSIAALVLGYMSLRQIRRSNGTEEGREFAVAGIVLGWIGVGILAIVIAVATFFAVYDSDDDDDVGQQQTAVDDSAGSRDVFDRGAPDPEPPPADTPAGELESTVLIEGSGEPAAEGDTLVVHYVVTGPDGTVLDSSWGTEPFSFTLGAGEVVAGWDEGLIGAREGERRHLLSGSDLAYGSEGGGGIPPDTPLSYEVDVIDILG
jgi:peptidylprolyl isomerase